jgi:RimJ/RimL family protein N-acetyltransferase
LFEANSLDVESRNWTYLPYGPFDGFTSYMDWLRAVALKTDTLFFAIVHKASGQAVGLASYLRIDPINGSIEVGHLNFSPLLQQKPAATEAMYLMMKNAFELGYRTYKWQCNALNVPSRRAAQRLGLSYEGVCRQAKVSKGRNRDTAWYATVDKEWPELQNAFNLWLDASNFDAGGKQKISLSKLTAPILKQIG